MEALIAEFKNTLREMFLRLKRFLGHLPFHVVGGFVAVVLLGAVVFLAALWPRSTQRAGEWTPLLNDGGLGIAIRSQYQEETRRLQLALDPKALGQVIASRDKQRSIAAHVRRFNRQLRNRRFDPKFIPSDSIFQVDMVRVDGKRQPRVSIRDLSPYNTHPHQMRGERSLGPIYLRPGNRPTPFLSDGFLGLSLDPLGDKTETVVLNRPGLFHAHRFQLVDQNGRNIATVWSGENGDEVFIQGEAGRGIFVENNAPHREATRGLKAGEVAEIGGRFFEVRIEAAPVLAMSTDRGTTQKRIYPMGANLHMVGPVSLNGRHQSLGLEYMFQEYLEGMPEADIPPGELWLTLDPGLQGLWVAGMAKLAEKDSEVQQASGLIMDAKTGAVLAMAAEPQPYDPGDSDRVLRMLDRREERFANHGCFRRHVVGSVTKPFFGFLALHLNPQWEQMQIDVTGSGSETLFGHRLYGARGKSMAFKRNQIDFGTYLSQSDNAFQHSLGLLLLSGTTGFDDIPRPWIQRSSKRGLVLKPTANTGDHLAIGSLGQRGRDSLTISRDHPIAQAARQIFDLETAPPGKTTHDRDLGIYAGILPLAEAVLMRHYPRLTEPGDVLKRRSVVCAPESPRLALEAVTNTKDGSALLYGGKFNRWTDIKLCEAFSRITTGRKTKANLIYQYRDTLNDGEVVQVVTEAPKFEAPADMPDTSIFASMRNHLAEVVGTGTAKKIQPGIRAIRQTVGSENFKIFAKTGTLDDGEGSDSRLFAATFGLWDESADAFTGKAYTFSLYVRNAVDEEGILRYIAAELPKWWAYLQTTEQR